MAGFYKEGLMTGARIIYTKLRPLVPLRNQILVDVNDGVITQNQMSISRTLSISAFKVTGEIIWASLVSTEDNTGAIIKEAADLLFFNADPLTTSGAEILTKAAAATYEGSIHIPEGDWVAGLNGTDTAGVSDTPAAKSFETDSTGNLYVVYVHRGTTTLNSAANDDEQIELNLDIRLDD